MEFGQALTGLKHGSRASREGWNGKGMWVVMVGAGHYDVGARTVGLNVRKDAPPALRPWLGLKAHNGDFVPWVASQSDILADDWVILEAEDYVANIDLWSVLTAKSTIFVYWLKKLVPSWKILTPSSLLVFCASKPLTVWKLRATCRKLRLTATTRTPRCSWIA